MTVTRLSPEQLAQLEAVLRSARRDLLASMHHRLVPGLTPAQLACDLAQLASVDAALERLEGGSFGLCLQCGMPTGAQRLRAIPTAQMCLKCQLEFEQHRSGLAS